MLLQPPVLALLLMSALEVAIALAVIPFAVSIVRHWDLGDASERQVRLERRTRLVSTLVAFAMGLQILTLPVLVFTADRLAAQLSGAMCAVGTLNANAYGFAALSAQMVAFFAAVAWLALDAMDVSVPTYPLTRIKYVAALVLAPLLALAAGLPVAFFAMLEPSVITSCCARVFASDAPSVSGALAAWPAGPAMIAFYVSLAAAVMFSLHVATGRRGRASAALAGGAGLVAFASVIAGVVSFLAPAVYDDVLHHCPFCFLKAEYHHQGYLIYVPLFVATANSTWLLCASLAARVPALGDVLPRSQRRWAAVAAAGFMLVALISSIMLARSHVTFQ